MNPETAERTSAERILVERCLAQDRLGQEQLYRAHADEMYNVTLLYTDNEDDACDVLQDSFVKVLSPLNDF